MSEELSKVLDEAERKRRKNEFYLTVRDVSILIILVSSVVAAVCYIAVRSGYAS